MHLNFDSPTASATLQRDLNQLEDWARLWKMYFNTNKCSILTLEIPEEIVLLVKTLCWEGQRWLKLILFNTWEF